MSAREQVLGRIRRALADVPGTERPRDVLVARDYRRAGSHPDPVGLFAERVRDYRAEVRRTAAADLPAVLRAALAEHGVRRVAVPAALPPEWLPAEVDARVDDGRLTTADLDGVDAAVTGCALAVAETGTVVLDGRGVSGRRAVTLLPDRHVCVVRAEQVVPTVPEAVAALDPVAGPVTFVSGPSATSDIELDRVEGVHGPRTLVVLLVE